MDDVKTGGLTDLRDKFRGNLFTTWTTFGIKVVGTCRPNDKGNIQVEDPTRMRVSIRGTGTDQLAVVLKSL
jgi:hypothetical protein